jgi:hypothetical protein
MLTLGVLACIYLSVGIVGIKYAYNFLIVQKRLKQTLLTAFYLFSILTCIARVLTYALIITIYFISNEYVVGIAIKSDMFSTSTILAVGIVQALTCVQLGNDMQVVYGERELWTWKTKLLLGLLVLQFSSLITLYVLKTDWVYYGLASWDFLVSISLYSALAYLMSVMSPIYHRINMHSELDTVRNIMGVFGLTFIGSFVLNFLKGYYIEEFVDVMVQQPWIFCIFSVLSSILVELCPVIVILKMHRINFVAPVVAAESENAITLNS